MNASPDVLALFRAQLRPALPGFLFSLLTLLFGFGIGVAFGAAEDRMKGSLAARAAAVRGTVYQDNDATIKATLDKSWAYVKRAHLHAGGLGATSVALIVITVLLGAPVRLVRAVGLASGLGGLAYSVYWLLAAYRAPGLGGTSAAKESLAWLALPSSAAIVAATLAVTALVLARLRAK